MKDIHVSKETLRKCIDKMFEPNTDFIEWLKTAKRGKRNDNNKKNVTKI